VRERDLRGRWTPPPLALVVAAALALGIAAGAERLEDRVWSAPAAGCAGVLGALAVVLRSRRWRVASLAGCALVAGCGLAWARLPAALPHGGREGLARVEGVVASAPREVAVGADVLAAFTPARASAVFTLRVEAFLHGWPAARVPARGMVLVRVADLGELPPRGTRVRVTGWFRPPGAALNPGVRAPPGDGTLAVPRRALIETLGRPGPTLPQRLREMVNTSLDAAMPAWAGASARALVKAMTTGVRDPALSIPAAEFRAAGLSHVLAISGFNVAVLVGAAALVAARLGARPWARTAVALLVCVLFLVLTEPDVSVLRAGLGAGIGAAAGLRGGRARGLGSLGAVATLTLLLDPEALFAPGFQLSYGVVLALLVLAPPGTRRWQRRADRVVAGVARRMPGAARWHETGATVARWLVAACVSSAVAFSASAPIALWHGGFASPYAAPISVVTMPAAALVTIGGVLAAGLGAVAPWLAGAPAGVACAAATVLARVARSAAEWPGALWWTGRPALWWVVLALAGVCACWAARRRARRLAAATGLAGLVLLAWCGAALPHAGRLAADVLRVDALNTGGGACVLVRSRDHAMLVNAGAVGDDSAGSRRIVPALAALGVRRLDALVVTADQMACFSAVPEVVRAFGVRRVVLPAELVGPDARVSRPCRALLAWLGARGVPAEPAPADGAIRAGDMWMRAGALRLEAWSERELAVVPPRIGPADPARRVERSGDGRLRAWEWRGSAWGAADEERALEADEIAHGGAVGGHEHDLEGPGGDLRAHVAVRR
jgi:competence protein ComEC